LHIGAAARSGGDVWIEAARSCRDERDEARQIAHQALQEAQQARQEADATHAQMDAAMLQARLAREEADQAESHLAALRQRYEELRTSLD
jgi:uncharacterized coiled-coil DUF342 family protein